MAFKPLNPLLYRMLRRAFGQVRVQHPGEVRTGTVRVDPFDRTRLIEKRASPGEEYAVCCCICNDTRFRLSVSYQYDPRGRELASRTRLYYCYNEHCRFNLADYLTNLPTDAVLPSAKVEDEPEEGPYKPREVDFPGDCLPLDRLSVNHAAARYVEDRRFDPVELWRSWGVRFCRESDNRFLEGRVIIPFEEEGRLIGWQARAVEERSKPKYLTSRHFRKSMHLFNRDGASTNRTAVVVEGVFDAFRVGRRAVALLGKTMSPKQRELLREWDGVTVALDSDAREEAERLADELGPHHFRLGVGVAELPDGKDPADCGSDELASVLRRAERAGREVVRE